MILKIDAIITLDESMYSKEHAQKYCDVLSADLDEFFTEAAGTKVIIITVKESDSNEQSSDSSGR